MHYGAACVFPEFRSVIATPRHPHPFPSVPSPEAKLSSMMLSYRQPCSGQVFVVRRGASERAWQFCSPQRSTSLSSSTCICPLPPSPLHSAPIAKDRFTKAAVRVRFSPDSPLYRLLPSSVAILSDARGGRKKPFCTRVWSVAVEVRHSSIYPIAPPSMPLAVHPVNLLRSLPFKKRFECGVGVQTPKPFRCQRRCQPRAAANGRRGRRLRHRHRDWVQKDRRARSRE